MLFIQNVRAWLGNEGILEEMRILGKTKRLNESRDSVLFFRQFLCSLPSWNSSIDPPASIKEICSLETNQRCDHPKSFFAHTPRKVCHIMTRHVLTQRKYTSTGDPTGLFPERKLFSLLEVEREWTQLKHKTPILPLTKILSFYLLLLVCICVYVTERDGRSIVTCHSACKSFRARLFFPPRVLGIELKPAGLRSECHCLPAAHPLLSLIFPPLLFMGWKACICESTLVPSVQVQ